MKIKEAVNVINSTTTVRAKVDGDYLNVFSKDMISHNWFLKLNTKAVNWDTVLKHWGGLTDVAPEDLARVMDVIQRLLDTPVNERFPEKKYCLRWFDDKLGKTFLGFNNQWTEKFWSTYGVPTSNTIFTESELEQLKKDNPRLAPAIDAMKEEVKGDDND